MRTYTLLASILVHVLGVGAAFVVPIVATADLPEPRRAFVYEVVMPLATPPEPPSAVRQRPAPRLSADAAPVSEPAAITPEPSRPFEAFDRPVADAGVVPGGGVGDVPVTGDPLPPPPAMLDPVRVGGAIRAPQKVVHVVPDYPAMARAARVSGVVIMEAVIGEDGGVRDVRILRSVPLLDEEAIRAVRQWRFTPTLLNGQPVPIVMTVTVSFSLQ
jgi:protein TonB